MFIYLGKRLARISFVYVTVIRFDVNNPFINDRNEIYKIRVGRIERCFQAYLPVIPTQFSEPHDEIGS